MRRARARAPGGVVVALALVLCCVGAVADQPQSFVTQLTAEVRESVRTPEGREVFRFAPASMLAQGEVVYYTLRIHNPTSAPLRDVTVVQQIPVNTTYVPASASAPRAQITFSVDGGETFLPASQLQVNVEGRMHAAGPEHYTHIRWRLAYPLAPGAVALARFRAVFR